MIKICSLFIFFKIYEKFVLKKFTHTIFDFSLPPPLSLALGCSYVRRVQILYVFTLRI